MTAAETLPDASVPLRATSTVRGAYVVLAVLAIAYMFNIMLRQLFPLLLPGIQKEMQLTDTQVGTLAGLPFSVSYATWGLLIASLADRLNRGYLIACCVAVFSVMTALCGGAPGFWTLLFARAGVGMGEAGATPASVSLISDHFPPHKRQFANALFTAGACCGLLIGLTFVGSLARAYGWRVALVSAGCSSFLLAAVIPFLIKDKRRVTDSQSHSTLIGTVSYLARNPAARCAVGGATFAYMGTASGYVWLPALFTRAHGLTEAQIGAILGVGYGALALAGALLAGVLTTRLQMRSHGAPIMFNAVAVFLIGAGFVVAFQAQPLWAVFMGLFFAMGLEAAIQVPLFTLFQEIIPPNMQAKAIAILLFIATIFGGTIGPILAGVISDALGGPANEHSIRLAGAAVAGPACFMSTWFYWRAAHHVSARALHV